MTTKLHAIGYVALVEAFSAVEDTYNLESEDDLNEVLEGMQEALNDLSLPEDNPEEEPYEGIGSYEVGKDNMVNRVMLIQLADSLVREFSEDFPFAYMDEVGPAPLLYWFREGVPAGGMDWDWLALYCYEGIAEAYKYIRETWLPNLPDLFEN